MNLTSKIKATALALGLSLLPAKEVDSGMNYSNQETQTQEKGSSFSYGARIGIGFNGDISLGAQVLTSRIAGLNGKFGVDFIVTGKDRGEFNVNVGVGRAFSGGITSTLEGRYNPKSENPLSLGFGLGYANVKKNKGNVNVNGISGCQYSYKESGEGEWLDSGAVCEESCITTGGTWGDEADETGSYCRCPEGKGLGAGGSCGTLH